jgi:hypothetical protein
VTVRVNTFKVRSGTARRRTVALRSPIAIAVSAIMDARLESDAMLPVMFAVNTRPNPR